MQSPTPTIFKQKKCPKCGNNHDNEGVLCSFCIQKAEVAKAKIQQPPADFWVKCLIVREGNTTLNMGNIQYTFKPNKHGDCVCEIINQGHYSQIIKSEFYEPYVEPEDVPADNIQRSKLFSNEDADLIDQFSQEGKKVAEIAAELSKLNNEEIPWQRVMKYIQNKGAIDC
jgi:hypothetical protein